MLQKVVPINALFSNPAAIYSATQIRLSPVHQVSWLHSQTRSPADGLVYTEQIGGKWGIYLLQPSAVLAVYPCTLHGC